MLVTLLLALAQAPAPAPTPASTVITNASGNLREWTRGAPGTLYVRDRTERWYLVTLTGPCRIDRPLDTLRYTTDPLGNFDRFSRINFARYPDTNCGVATIRRSAPPPDRKRR